ncbi:MAG: helix-turn-helix transcriptional regulator [Cytophagales bacterium]|nr:helix-turn-helix transcriptional regulator [Cytophagales bacterium]
MADIVHLKTIAELNRAMRQSAPNHPLVSVIDFTKVEESFAKGTRISTDFYSIMFKNYCSNKIKYGRQLYDFQEGHLICIAPKHVVVFDDENDNRDDKMGWGLFFHPDLIRGSALGSKMNDYSYFSYDTSEALHLSEKEKQTLYDCVLNIKNELQENIDDYSQRLIISNIDLFLNYCSRYYGRQFITRKNANHDTVTQIENLLQEYFSKENTKLPTVKYLAERVHLSPSYLSDLLRKETGMNAQGHIHYILINEAKNKLLSTNKSVSEIAYSLGFYYPPYFSKLFKQKTGKTPVEYRNIN